MEEDEVKNQAEGTEETTATPENTETSESSEATETTPIGSDNSKAIEYIGRFAPDSPSSTPEEIIAGLVKCMDITSIPYDKLYDIVLHSPEDAAFAHDYLETGDPVKSLVRNFDPEEVMAAVEAMKEDDSYEEDRTNFAGKVKGRKDREAMMATNMTNSQMGAQEFVDRKGLDEAQIEEFKPFVDKFLKDCEDRNLTADNWETIYNGFKRDGDVAEAEENGRAMGRNEQIVAKKATRADLAGLLPEVNAGIEKTPERKKSFAEEFMSDI